MKNLLQYLRIATVAPEGVYEDVPGTLGLDTTNGDAYIKHTGTGNTGWVLLSGDENSELTAEQSVANFNLSGSYADITGMSVTLDKAGVWMITASVQFNVDISDSVAARFVGDGTPNAVRFIVIQNSGAASQQLMGTQTWIYTAAAPGEVAKIQAEILVSVGGTSQTVQDGTTLTAVFLHA